MTYFGFLARFVVLPMLILRFLLWWDKKHHRKLPDSLSSWDESHVLLGHATVAVSYTTIWDNYLVYADIWSYDPKLVTGYTIGWVPIEEYSFFVLQPLLTGSLWQYLARRQPIQKANHHSDTKARFVSTGVISIAWFAAVIKLIEGHPNNKYLTLILSWALPPIMLQTVFGADILWRNRRLIASTVVASTVYLAVADSVAISEGTWRISPKYTIQREVIKNLPFEEFLFFLLTNTLLVNGITLVQSKESEKRLPKILQAPYKNLKEKWLGRI